MRDHDHLPRRRAVAGDIDLPDAPEPARERLPRVIVASGAAESGPRFYVSRELGLDLAIALGAEDAPQLRRRGRR